MRALLRSTLLALAALGALAAPAAADPILDLEAHHTPTNFSPPFAGSVAVATITQGSPAVSETQEVTVTADSGSFVLCFEGACTADLPVGADNGEVRTALRALPTLITPTEDRNVNVPSEEISGSTTVYTVNFVRDFANTDVAELSAAPGAAPLLREPPGRYSFDLRNVGDSATEGEISLAFELPAGLTVTAAGGVFRISDAWADALNGGANATPWSCPGAVGVSGPAQVVCTTDGPIPRHTLNDGLQIDVAVDPAAAGTAPLASAEATGGGAALAASAAEPTPISASPAGFGILAHSFRPDFYASDARTPVRRSGAHPDQLIVPFDFHSIANPGLGEPFIPDENIRDVVVDLPPGFLGDPTAVGECDVAKFTLSQCPGSAQVGRVDVKVTGFPSPPVRIGVFNLPHPRGVVTDLAFSLVGNPVHTTASLDPSRGYAITTETRNINETLPALHQRFTVWGAPAEESHDSERCRSFKANVVALAVESNGDTFDECSTDFPDPPLPFLTVPSVCGTEHQVRLRDYDSWQDTGDFGPDILYTQPGETVDCDVPRFNPSVEAVPTGTEANAPTGLDVSIRVPQNENPNALATPPVRSTVITFPEGMTFNPAFADGLDGCTMAQFGIAADGTPNGAAIRCPDNSRVGEVSLTTPLLPRPVVGSMYLAKPLDNPCGTNFALYMAVADTEGRGILIKIPGCIELDERTGQIVTSFDELPQFPFDTFTLSFRSGQRAPLVTPPVCGTQRIGIEVASYAQPNDPVDASNSFEIDEGPGGSACPAGLDSRPFDPDLQAGTLNPVAGAFAPFIFRLSRSDAEQEISRVQAILPPGMAARLAGTSYCPESVLAGISGELLSGRGEANSPSCPDSSHIGDLNVGVGSGQNPNFFRGSLYLAGPYRGAPVSMVAVIPALAGPYDLGSTVVRSPAHFDPRSAQVRVSSDALPTILHGVLLRVRDVRLFVDKPQFTLNPTSCAEKKVIGLIDGAGADLFSGLDDAQALLENRFQVGDCASLGFRPRFFLRLFGKRFGRSSNPRFRAVVMPRPGDANISRSSVTMPSSLFLDQDHIRTICTRAQFATDTCPKRAIYGRAVARTPLLDEPLRGPVYLRSSDNPLPDLVADLRGQVRVEVAGKTDSVRGALRNIFEVVPDAPVTKFVLFLQGGRKGLLVASRNLCSGPQRARVNLSGQNGKRYLRFRRINIPCRKRKGKRRGGAKRRAARRASVSGARAVR